MPSVPEALEQIIGENVFITCEPELPDFTETKRPAKILVMAKGLKFEFPLPPDQKEFLELISGLNEYLYREKIITIGWNIKGLFSYIRFRTGSDWPVNGAVLDLKVLEAYAGKRERECPKSFKDALYRLNQIIKDPAYERVVKVYQDVYLPLVTKVVPRIEATGLNDLSKRRPVYPCYEIEGQINGRMKCLKVFAHSFNPHSLDDGLKTNLRPIGYDYLFMMFDYRQMEVAVLQWLSQDQALKKCLDEGEDVYKIIWERITKLPCDKDSLRAACKAVFLPVIYGQGYKAVAQRLKRPESVGEQLVRNIRREFPTAMAWVEQQQDTFDANNNAFDYFGRKRTFDEQQYKVRNFVVQAPASIICLHKLVRLHTALQGNAEIVFHIHDGYGIITHKKNISVADLAMKTLESEEALYPGLKLRVTGSMGEHLDKLSLIQL
jgi:hypothetical protein